jgi:transposase-like protein
MFHRIREAMRSDVMPPMGSGGGVVEVDETFIGKEPGKKMGRAYHHKMKVLSLLDRDSGSKRSVVIDDLTAKSIEPVLRDNIAKEAKLYTDEAMHYRKIGAEFAEHEKVEHGKDEYVRGPIHTNTIEGSFSVFKRGMKGVYQHCGKQHLHRYLAEFDFRYSNRASKEIDDTMRANAILKGAEGKRLTYRRTNSVVA